MGKLEGERQLLSLMKGVIRRFSQHQKLLIYEAADGDNRLQREADGIFDTSTDEVELLYISGQPSKVVLVASIKNLDLRQLQPFLDRNWAIDGKMPEEAVQ